MCYGLQKSIKLNFIKNRKKRLNDHYKITGQVFYLRANLKGFEAFFYVPSNWNFIFIFKQSQKDLLKNLYFFSNLYFFFIPSSFYVSQINFQQSTRVLQMRFFNLNSFYRIYWKFIKLVFYSFSYFFFKKLKFRGKGYYIFKNTRNTVTFRFGYSHRIYLYFYGIFVKFLSKTSIFMFGIKKTELFFAAASLRAVRPYNIFTGKGVRFTRQIIYKKIGKVGSYR